MKPAGESVAGHRKLEFADLGAAVREIESLHAQGYERLGAWDLAQICDHLDDWLRYPMDGYPALPWWARPLAWIARQTIGRSQLRFALETGTLPARGPTLSATVHAAGGDERQAIERLVADVRRWEQFAGPSAASPLFGVLDQDTARRLQCVHFAHHLGYLRPRSH